MIVTADSPEKRCLRCWWWLPADLGFFSSDIGEPDGLHPICRSCLQQQAKEATQ